MTSGYGRENTLIATAKGSAENTEVTVETSKPEEGFRHRLLQVFASYKGATAEGVLTIEGMVNSKNEAITIEQMVGKLFGELSFGQGAQAKAGTAIKVKLEKVASATGFVTVIYCLD